MANAHADVNARAYSRLHVMVQFRMHTERTRSIDTLFRSCYCYHSDDDLH